MIGNFVQYVNFLELIYGSGISNYITSEVQYCGGQNTDPPMSQWTTAVGYLLNSFTDSYLIYTYVYHCSLFRVQRLQEVIILSTTAYVITAF